MLLPVSCHVCSWGVLDSGSHINARGERRAKRVRSSAGLCVRCRREAACSLSNRPSSLPACTPDWIRENWARFLAAGLERRVGDGLDRVEAADDERKWVDGSGGLALPELKVDMGNSPASPRGRGASLAEALAALDFLAGPDVNLIHVAIARPPGGGVTRLVLEGYTSCPFNYTCDHAIGGGNHWISLGGVEVETGVKLPKNSLPARDAGPRAVVRQDPGGTLLGAPRKHDRMEQCDLAQTESPYDEARIAPPQHS